MRIVKPARVRESRTAYPDADLALAAWLKVARNAQWSSIRDVRSAYPHADAVSVRSGRTVTVFNVSGNKYRLILAIHYKWSMIYVLRFLTHAEYDKGKWKEQL